MPAETITNKTDFMRFLNEHEGEVPSLKKLAAFYRKENRTRHTFGQWMRNTHITEFQDAYAKWWLKNPQRWAEVYESTEQAL